MEEKRPIDMKRDSAGYTDIGTEADGAIVTFKNIGGRILVIKERSIYEMTFADKIDPNRTNISLPPTIHKRIIDKGTESEIVSRTFLTSLILFREEYISKEINVSTIISLTIDLLSEFSILEKEIKEYQLEEKMAADKYEERREQKASYQTPAVMTIESKCKTIFQKADHIEQILMEIIVNFYPSFGLTKQSHWPKFYEKLVERYGNTDGFVKFISKTENFMQIVRELRNGFDHRLEHTKVSNFELQADGNIIAPTIELNHKKIKLPQSPLNEFLGLVIENLLNIIECLFAYLAAKNTKTSHISHQVREIPEAKRRNKFIRYCFWTPFGEEGFFNQNI